MSLASWTLYDCIARHARQSRGRVSAHASVCLEASVYYLAKEVEVERGRADPAQLDRSATRTRPAAGPLTTPDPGNALTVPRASRHTLSEAFGGAASPFRGCCASIAARPGPAKNSLGAPGSQPRTGQSDRMTAPENPVGICPTRPPSTKLLPSQQRTRRQSGCCLICRQQAATSHGDHAERAQLPARCIDNDMPTATLLGRSMTLQWHHVLQRRYLDGGFRRTPAGRARRQASPRGSTFPYADTP